MKTNTGIFTVSLDFELYWGIRDKITVKEYGENVLGVWTVVPRLLDLFKKYQIHCSWAIVGAMMSADKNDLLRFLPNHLPTYSDSNLSPFNSFLANIEVYDPKLIYGDKLLDLVKNAANQEICSHSFSHYYCLEPGQNAQQFESDIVSTIEMAKLKGIEIKSYVFPRHQINPEYFEILKKYNINIFRETEKIWYHTAARGADEGLVKRAFRYADYFLKMGSHHTQKKSEIKNSDFYRIRASRWMRPYSRKLDFLDSFKIRRIKNQMTYAAKKGEVFHLWFHPHDIGINQEENFKYLEEIFQHYQSLKENYGFISKNMKEIVLEIDNG